LGRRLVVVVLPMSISHISITNVRLTGCIRSTKCRFRRVSAGW
jgi:hypothetical protein